MVSLLLVHVLIDPFGPVIQAYRKRVPVGVGVEKVSWVPVHVPGHWSGIRCPRLFWRERAFLVRGKETLVVGANVHCN